MGHRPTRTSAPPHASRHQYCKGENLLGTTHPPMNHASPISSSSYSFASAGPSQNAVDPSTVSRPTGLKLILPPLKGGKLIKGVKRSAAGYGPSFARELEVKKPQRPPKLKPLKEVLTKLINLIKK